MKKQETQVRRVKGGVRPLGSRVQFFFTFLIFCFFFWAGEFFFKKKYISFHFLFF